MLKTRSLKRSKKEAGTRGDQGQAPRNQAGRPTLAELERRKETVLEVATQLFVAQGYAQTSLVDIAKQAGVATRTLYQHFGDKEAIFREVIYARRSAPLIPAPSVQSGTSIFDTLMVTAQMTYDYVLLDNSLDLMRLMVAESRRFPSLMARVATATFARFNANVTTVFEALAVRGMIPEDDHAESARFFLDMLLGNMAMMNYTGWQRSRPEDTVTAKKIEMFILGRFGPSVAARAHSGSQGAADRNQSSFREPSTTSAASSPDATVLPSGAGDQSIGVAPAKAGRKARPGKGDMPAATSPEGERHPAAKSSGAKIVEAPTAGSKAKPRRSASSDGNAKEIPSSVAGGTAPAKPTLAKVAPLPAVSAVDGSESKKTAKPKSQGDKTARRGARQAAPAAQAQASIGKVVQSSERLDLNLEPRPIRKTSAVRASANANAGPKTTKKQAKPSPTATRK